MATTFPYSLEGKCFGADVTASGTSKTEHLLGNGIDRHKDGV